MASFKTASDPSKSIQGKDFSVARTMTTGTDVAFVLPKGSRIIGFVLSGTASDAGTSAVLNVGTTLGTPTQFVSGLDVKTAATGSGLGVLRGQPGQFQTRVTVDTIVYVQITEVGTASSVGSWVLTMVYTTGSIYEVF